MHMPSGGNTNLIIFVPPYSSRGNIILRYRH